jgi:hypothetical protein
MKTAMQEAINYIDRMQNDYIKKSKETKDKNYQKGVEAILTATTLIKIQAKDLLEKEKEQMIVFGKKMQLVQHVSYDDDITYCFEPEEYYNQTYNQTK